MLTLLVTTVLIAVNWLTYIYAVWTRQVLQSSLGYFITPLVNVLLGVVFLRERLRIHQTLAIGLAAIGVLILTFTSDQFPWIAMTLAVSFAFYGLLRKTVAVDGLLALLIETVVLLPVAAGYLGYLALQGESAMATGPTRTTWLLLASGAVTTVPLLLFAGAARRLRMSTLGILQYLAPSVQFSLAVLVFNEPFTRAQLASFCCIWVAVIAYSLSSLRLYRRSLAAESLPVTTEA
jgi:chloramphenicol-sensitive protein RarD